MMKAIELRTSNVGIPINKVYFSFFFSSFCLLALNTKYSMNSSAIVTSKNINLM